MHFVSTNAVFRKESMVTEDVVSPWLQVRVVALGCAADLFKSPDAQNYLAAHPDFLQVLVQCMQVCTLQILSARTV